LILQSFLAKLSNRTESLTVDVRYLALSIAARARRAWSAAAAVGRNKTAILRAIKAGKISVAKDENGEWQIDPAELHRIYPPLRSSSMRGNDMQPHLHQSPLLTPV